MSLNYSKDTSITITVDEHEVARSSVPKPFMGVEVVHDRAVLLTHELKVLTARLDFVQVGIVLLFFRLLLVNNSAINFYFFFKFAARVR